MRCLEGTALHAVRWLEGIVEGAGDDDTRFNLVVWMVVSSSKGRSVSIELMLTAGGGVLR